MRPHIPILGLMFLALAIFADKAISAVEVRFGPDIIAKENAGNVWISLRRKGDLSVTTSVLYWEDWSNATLKKDELLYNFHVAPSAVSYDSSGRYATVTFHSGVSQINIPYSITNDQEVEDSEFVNFNIVGVASSSGSTTIGKKSIRIQIDDDDGNNALIPSLGVYGGTITDEGNKTRSFAVLSEPTSHNVTFRVSTNYNTYKEANYPVQDDYQDLYSKLVTIPAGFDFAWIPIQTYQNNDKNDALYESFQLCIDSGSVSGAVINVPCAQLFIKDIPITEATSSNVASIIFEDAVGAGWSNSSWGVSPKFGGISYDGAFGIEANFTYPWAGLSFSSNGFNTTGFDTISFAVRGSNSNNGAGVVVVAYLADGSVNNVPLKNYIPNGRLVTNEWYVVHIPLWNCK